MNCALMCASELLIVVWRSVDVRYMTSANQQRNTYSHLEKNRNHFLFGFSKNLYLFFELSHFSVKIMPIFLITLLHLAFFIHIYAR